ncbi:indole-3-acetaldehyde oxidase-like [Coccinella septempunctata]|uniref:indole-3-acetaldehyde oxidase-like n=1 Tax=Coccinella septempunctata TaxID=41139 RepID=UPI001D05F523|nr:indole-3-acetaldehyde oxidase-like [Coccinella septempunctata]
MLSWFSSGNNAENNVEIESKTSIQFTIQGELHTVNSLDVVPKTTLNDYLRQKMFLMGTKRMCNEGGCGACVVVVKKPGNDKYIAVNSCLISILTCHEWKIETIEGIGGPLTKYNPIQLALANFNGTQCGFCSSGMVMNMYALSKNGKPSMKEVENSFGGNICRCTGYRPILSAFKSLCKDACTNLIGTYPDIEDFCLVDPDMLGKSNMSGFGKGQFEIKYGTSTWTKVTSLNGLLDVIKKLGDKTYMLVAGNTGKGVYKLPTPSFYIDVIDVKELTKYELDEGTLKIGANCSLSHTMDLFNQISQLNKSFAYLKTIADHMDLIAHVPVRNVGTLAGNLMLKHYHHEFPSDVFLLLETFAATLVIVQTDGTEILKTLPEFLQLDMKKKVIKTIQLKSLTDHHKYETFKIMPRAQNAHAMVNAGFLFELDSTDTVKSSRIVFGNINPSFIHAENTERYLTGKKIFDNNTLQGAFKTLSEELKPEDNPPEPEPEFRKNLAIALLYKGVLKMAPKNKLSPKNATGGALLKRPISSGVQEYETKKSLYPLTKPIPKLEALAQTTGQAQYIDDIPDLPHQLYGKFILADAAPNSKIVKIDATKALAMKGVVRLFTKDDIPGENNFFPKELGFEIVEKLFCDKIVEFNQQPLGLLVASDKDVLDDAAGLVEVEYTPPKESPLLSVREILAAKASDRLIKEKVQKPVKKGTDVKHKLKGSFDMKGQYHFHMELQCCLAVPSEDGLEVYPSTQWMDATQIGIAKVLNVPHNKIRINVRRLGGGFGAKISRNNIISCAAGLAAWLLKKPVRISLSLKENMGFIGKRFPFSVDYEVGVNDGGVIQYLNCEMYGDHGIGGNEQIVSDYIFSTMNGNYNNESFDLVYYRAKTDCPAYTWARAPGSSDGIAFMESLMEHISHVTKIDPLDVRINNISTRKELFDYLGDLKEWADIDERKVAIEAFNEKNRWKKKGISVVPMAWPFEQAGPIMATVSIYHVDGSVSISHGGIEIGQGINTKAAQVCAYKFNIPLEKVNIIPSNNMVSANSFITGGSWTSEAVCYGVIQACEELLRRLKPYREEDSDQTWEALINSAFADYVLLTANAQYSPKSPFLEAYYVYGACAAEVELDILTGQHQVTRVDLIEDTGTSLSPYVDIGQVEGAFIMGLGYFTSEKLIYDEKGKMLTNNTWTYKPPGMRDIPIDFRVKFPKNRPNPVGVLQSKAVGEPPLCMSVSVPIAIRNAVASARKDADPSKPTYFFFDGPTTVENTFMNSLNDYKQYVL